jgi:DNA-binding response OmpR family regulator
MRLRQTIARRIMTITNPKHILIADDDLELRTMLALVLRDEGYRVSHAVNGKEAIELHRRTPLDLVIAELGLNGFEAFVEMRRHSSPVKFITTSNTSRLSFELCQRMGEYLGSHCFMAKPFSSERLLIAVKSALA